METANIKTRLSELNTKAYYLLVALSFVYRTNPTRSLKWAFTLTALVAVLPVQDIFKSNPLALEILRWFKFGCLTLALAFTLLWLWCAVPPSNAESPQAATTPLASPPSAKAPHKPTQAQLDERIKKLETDLADQKQKLAAAQQTAAAADQKAGTAVNSATQKEKGWLANHSFAIQAIVAIAGIVLTAALVGTTIFYANITAKILKESEETRKAAQLQARAARDQASIAQRSLETLQQQFEEQAGLANSVVQTTMDSAMSAIEYWKAQDLPKLANMGCLPPTDALAPPNAAAAVHHARRIHADSARRLSSAFDDLQAATSEIEIMRALGRGGTHGPSFYQSKCDLVVQYLEGAFKLLQKAQAGLIITARGEPGPFAP
jgi:hypothetical protein